MQYTLSAHARARLDERAIDEDAVAAALAGREVQTGNGLVYYDCHSRTVVIVEASTIVTAFRFTRRQVKQRLSR